MGGKEGREGRERWGGKGGEREREEREERERPGTVVQHQVSALTSYNENNNSVKMLLITNDSSNSSYDK